MASPASRGRGVQSVEVSIRILAALARNGGPMALSAVAEAVGMPPAKVHRYLASFVGTGMAERRRSGTYDLGPLAAEIGVAAIARIDPVNRAADRLPGIVEATGLTGMLSVWGSAGPTIVRWERARDQLITALGVGSVLPVVSSATGRAFLMNLPERVWADRAAAETGRTAATIRDAITAALAADGVHTADGDFIPGLSAMALPVLAGDGHAAGVVTLIAADATRTAPGSAERKRFAAMMRPTA